MFCEIVLLILVTGYSSTFARTLPRETSPSFATSHPTPVIREHYVSMEEPLEIIGTQKAETLMDIASISRELVDALLSFVNGLQSIAESVEENKSTSMEKTDGLPIDSTQLVNSEPIIDVDEDRNFTIIPPARPASAPPFLK